MGKGDRIGTDCGGYWFYRPDSLIGRLAVVTAEINNLGQSGEVILSDVSWTARSKEDGRVIPVGSKVRICAIEGVKLIVEEIKEEETCLY